MVFLPVWWILAPPPPSMLSLKMEITSEAQLPLGLILPLMHSTSALPSCRGRSPKPPSVIGRNTVHSIQSGLLYGYVGLVEGIVARFRQELGADMKVIATGGLADIIAPETEAIQIVAPWLTLDGLQMIWEMNKAT